MTSTLTLLYSHFEWKAKTTPIHHIITVTQPTAYSDAGTAGFQWPSDLNTQMTHTPDPRHPQKGYKLEMKTNLQLQLVTLTSFVILDLSY